MLSTRVGRIVDRSRHIKEKLADSSEQPHQDIQCELDILSRRAHWANWAISLCTTCALFICALIVVLFVGAFLNLDVSTTIAMLFIAAMTALILGLLCFLKEIHLAIASLQCDSFKVSSNMTDSSGWVCRSWWKRNFAPPT